MLNTLNKKQKLILASLYAGLIIVTAVIAQVITPALGGTLAFMFCSLLFVGIAANIYMSMRFWGALEPTPVHNNQANRRSAPGLHESL